MQNETKFCYLLIHFHIGSFVAKSILGLFCIIKWFSFFLKIFGVITGYFYCLEVLRTSLKLILNCLLERLVTRVFCALTMLTGVSRCLLRVLGVRLHQVLGACALVHLRVGAHTWGSRRVGDRFWGVR